jgi:hypothetical protein
MSMNYTFTIITTYDRDGLVKHWGWEITTRAAIITNRQPIAQEKNTCYKSIVHHAKMLLRIDLDRAAIKERNIIL